MGLIYKNKQTAAWIGTTHHEDRVNIISSAHQIKNGICKRYTEEEIMEAAITVFCPELSLGSNLEEQTELGLPKAMCILRSHLHLFPDNELYRELSRTEQEPKEPP